MNKKILFVLVMIITVFGITSCDLIGGIFSPAYVGTWEYIEADMEAKEILTIEKEVFESVIQINDGGTWIDLQVSKGTLVVEGDSMTITTTDVKYADYDSSTDTFIFPEEWEPATGLLAEPQTGTWIVLGKNLTFANDDNDIPTRIYIKL